MILTSQSALADFKRCRKLYDFKEIRGWTPRSGNWAMSIGTGYHLCVAAGYNAVREFDAAFKSAFSDKWVETDANASAARSLAWLSAATAAAYKISHDRDGLLLTLSKEDRELIEDMVCYFWEHMGAADLKTLTEILFIEEPVYIQIGEFVIRCTLDLVASEHNNPLPVLFDHKTVGDVKLGLGFLDLDFQLKTYFSAARGRFAGIDRFVHTFVNREVPPGFGHRSLLTESGKTRSKATLESMQDPSKYLRRAHTPLANAQIDAHEQNLVRMIRDIERAKVENYFPSSPLKGNFPGCEGCPFRAPCVAEDDGREVGAINLSYIVRGTEEWEQLRAGKIALEVA